MIMSCAAYYQQRRAKASQPRTKYNPSPEDLEKQNYQYSRSLRTFRCFYIQICLLVVETTVVHVPGGGQSHL